MIIILGIYFVIFGFGCWFFVWKVMYFGGVYDMWVLGGGDVCVISYLIYDLLVIFGYLFKLFFGGDGWIMFVDNMEDVIGGYIWIGIILIIGGFWYIFIKLFVWVCCVFVWFGEVYFLYSFVVVLIMVFILVVFVWFNNIVYFFEFFGLIGLEVL